jgi:hypothetical protein
MKRGASGTMHAMAPEPSTAPLQVVQRPLPSIAQVPNFYVISSETAARGFEELLRSGFAHFEVRTVKDAMAPAGKRNVKFWHLLAPYDRGLKEAVESPARLRRVK